MTDVFVNPSENIIVNVTDVADASSIGFTSTNAGLSSEANVSTAVNELASRFFQLSATPTGNDINEGDLWYDLTASQLKVYSGSAWAGLTTDSSLANTTDNNGWLQYASPSTYTSGALLKIKNNTNTVFEVNFDGSLSLESVSNKGTAVTGRFVFDGTSVYIGI